MKENAIVSAPDIHHRRSIRLKDYDYSQPGVYFITITTWQRFPLLGEIKDQTMHLSEYGKISQSRWERIGIYYAYIELDTFIVMPNHIHGIIIINNVGAGSFLPSTKPAPIKRYPVSEIVRAFKTFSARQINIIRKTPGVPVWQRNYYEHVVRDDDELNQIRE
jgi:putative transposase